MQLLTDLLGFRIVTETEGRIRLGVNGDGAGKLMDVVYRSDAPPALNGLGTVHHVALAIGSAEEQVRAREELLTLGYGVTDVLDRQYFQSIYFREPGGVLLEIATVRPGLYRRRAAGRARPRPQAAAVGGSEPAGNRRGAGGGGLLADSYQLSVFSYQLSAISSQQSVLSNQHWLLATGY